MKFKLFSCLGGCWLMLLSLLLQAQEHPRKMWVFRSVLDRQPRIVNVALEQELYVAYDAKHCRVFKVWKAGVKLQGPVYNHQHGPQPISKGHVYCQGIQHDTPCFYIHKGEQIFEPVDSVQFKGYYWGSSAVKFTYWIYPDFNRDPIILHETPSYVVSKRKHPSLKQVFSIENNPKGSAIATRTKVDLCSSPSET